MKKLCTLLMVCLPFFMSAQFPGGFGGNKGPSLKGKLTGIVTDSITGEAVPYATIVLKKANMKSQKDGGLSSDDGKFKFDDVKTGKYDLYVSFLGYNEKLVEDVELTPKKPDLDIGAIQLSPSDFVLDEVEVTAERSLFENKIDRIVYNAENDASVSGGDATDVLRKVPTLVVDFDGNVSIRGTQNVKILINGKPSGMFSSNVSEALKMFPADQIKKVEVITSPGAKYDAEGTGGIVNIITKKQNVDGVAGSINISAGTRQNSAVASLNAGKGRFGFSSSGSMYYSLPNDATNGFERYDTLMVGVRSYIQDGIIRTSRLGFNGSMSAFYDFNAYNAINASVSGRGFAMNYDGFSNSAIYSPDIDETFNFVRNMDGDNLFSGVDFNLDYTKKFEKNKDQELVIAYQRTTDIQDQNNIIIETGELIEARNGEINNDSDNIENTYQIDYVQPLKKGLKLETGVKMVVRDIDSEATDLLFDYDQDVYSAYGQFSFNIKKFNFITGLRYENTSIMGISNGQNSFENDYDNWLKSFTVSRNLKNFRSIKVSYTERIQRPGLFFINPFNNNVDPFNITIGNPNLSPELTNQIELGYNTNFKGIGIFSTVYYKNTTDIIQSILDINDAGISINTYENTGTNKSFGLNLFSTKTINLFTIRGGFNIFSYNASGIVNGMELSRKTYEYNVFFSGEYAISGTVKADVFGFLKSPQRTLQGDNPSFGIWGVGVKKEFKDWSLGIRIIEPFSENKSFNTSLSGEGFSQNNSFTMPFRSFGLSLSYKFGKVDFKERKSKIKNKDVKSGDGGQGAGQGGGGFGQG